MEDIYDLIIIGAGPAGMTAGIYAKRQGLKTLMITDGFGGQMARKSVDVENYPGFEKISGFELIKKFENHLKKYDIEIKIDKVASLEKENDNFVVSTKNNEKFFSKTVIVASGAEPKMLNIPGEKEFIGKGVSYCPICEGPMFKNKAVAVIGGGNAGCEASIFLLNYAKKVYVLEFAEEINADIAVKNVVSNSDKAELITGAKLKEIKGEKFVNSVVYINQKTGEEKTIDVAGVFIEVGYKPAISFIGDGLVEYNTEGEIICDPNTCQSKTAGLYGAGDVTGGKCKQIVVASGEGAKSAISASRFIKGIK